MGDLLDSDPESKKQKENRYGKKRNGWRSKSTVVKKKKKKYYFLRFASLLSKIGWKSLSSWKLVLFTLLTFRNRNQVELNADLDPDTHYNVCRSTAVNKKRENWLRDPPKYSLNLKSTCQLNTRVTRNRWHGLRCIQSTRAWFSSKETQLTSYKWHGLFCLALSSELTRWPGLPHAGDRATGHAVHHPRVTA